MTRLFLAALLAVFATLATTGKTQAQPHPHFPPFGCGGFCVGFLSKLHFHGPLYNYGPYSGYYPFEPYGPWSADLQYNPPPLSCGQCGKSGCGGSPGWGRYAVSTLKNVFQRVNPLANRCGGSLNLGKCGTCSASSDSATPAPCATGGCAAEGCSAAGTSVEPPKVSGLTPRIVPVVHAGQIK